MSEPLDNELRKRINEVFDNFEDTAPAEEGWLLLREKFPFQKKRRIVPIWWSAAAVLLVLCLFGIWFFNQQQKVEQTVVKTQQKPLNYTDTTTTKNIVPANESQAPANPYEPAGKQYANTQKQNRTDHNSTRVAASSAVVSNVDKPSEKYNAVEEQVLAANALPHKPDAGNSKSVTSGAVATATTIPGQDSTVFPNSNVFAQQSAKAGTVVGRAKDTVADVSKTPMAIYLANEQRKETAKKPQAEKLLADKKILYSIYAATYFNYADGSKSQVNTGAGFSTDIKLFSNFKLTTGIAIGKNTLNYDGQPMQSGLLNEAVSLSRGTASDVSLAATLTGSPGKNTSLGLVSLKVPATPIVAGYNVSLTGLDVPLNIKYEFNPKKSDTYVSAGLSSGTFINESYTYRYDNSLNAFGASTTSIPDISTSRTFTRFGFARTLNLAMGMGYQITPGNRLVIEPFFNYPLSGLGSQQIKFGAGGVNLRLKFQGAKK